MADRIECGACDRVGVPRHVRGLFNRPGQAPPVPLHVDCCADTGCGVCAATITEAGGRRGVELADHLAALRAARSQGN